MEKDLPQLTDLTPYYEKTDWVQRTANQLSKDFESFGYTISFSGKVDGAYDELLNQIHPIVQDLLRTDRHQFLNLLYRIDLGEKNIAQRFAESEGLEFDEVVAQLIIERELKKVVLRAHFAKNQNQ